MAKLDLLVVLRPTVKWLLPSDATQDSQAHLLGDHLQDPVELAQHPLVDQEPHGRVQDITVGHHAVCRGQRTRETVCSTLHLLHSS